jgi:aspartyl-tRNA(Asn)/glutamyl-tRNA(Gln) amidotransferase subunit C
VGGVNLCRHFTPLQATLPFLFISHVEMTVNQDQIQQLAKLARLSIADDQAQQVAMSISNVLKLVDQLATADTSNVTPMAHPLDAVQILRADIVTEPNVRDQMLALAPAAENGFFLVPKVID